jgi:hypothetical protein
VPERKSRSGTILDCGPPWCDLLGIDCCLGNIPEGQRVVLLLRKIDLGQGFWIQKRKQFQCIDNF